MYMYVEGWAVPSVLSNSKGYEYKLPRNRRS